MQKILKKTKHLNNCCVIILIMGNNVINLSVNEKKFLGCILDNGNITDTEIAKNTKISKSTCSRIRKKLEKSLISEYIPIIPLDKVGINVFLVLTFQWIAFDNNHATKNAFSKFENDPNVVFLANGECSTVSTVMFIAFEDLDDYHTYIKEFRKNYGKYTDNINVLLLPSKDVIKNDFTEVIKKSLEGKKYEK